VQREITSTINVGRIFGISNRNALHSKQVGSGMSETYATQSEQLPLWTNLIGLIIV
jgi:hypothetical protein